MTNGESSKLEALRQLLDLTDESDWHLFHATVRQDVRDGKLSATFEQAYKSMVDELRRRVE